MKTNRIRGQNRRAVIGEQARRSTKHCALAARLTAEQKRAAEDLVLFQRLSSMPVPQVIDRHERNGNGVEEILLTRDAEGREIFFQHRPHHAQPHQRLRRISREDAFDFIAIVRLPVCFERDLIRLGRLRDLAKAI